MIERTDYAFERNRIMAMWHGYYESVPARQVIVPVGICYASRLVSFASYATSGVAIDRTVNWQRQNLINHACSGSIRSTQNVYRRNCTRFKKTLIWQGIKYHSVHPISRKLIYSIRMALTMLPFFQRLTSYHPARRQAPLCLPADLANAHTPSTLGSADHSIWT